MADQLPEGAQFGAPAQSEKLPEGATFGKAEGSEEQAPQTEPSGIGEQLKRAFTNPMHAMMGHPEKVQPAGRGFIGAASELSTGLAGFPSQVGHAMLDQPTNEEEANLYNQAHDIGQSTSMIQGIGAGGADVDAHAALAYKRLVTDGVVESYQKARRLELQAEKEKDPKRKKALMDAAGAYGTTDFKDNTSFRNVLSNLLHGATGSGAGMLPFLGPLAAKSAETAQYGDLEKGDFNPDPVKGVSSLLMMALLPHAQEKAFGAIKGAAGAVTSKIGEKVGANLNPVTETVGRSEVPVRNPSTLGKVAQAAVPDTMQKFAAETTGPAVAKGMGQTAQDAVGTSGEVKPTQTDPIGYHAEADKLVQRSKPVFEKLDEVSGGMLTEAQDRARRFVNDDSGHGVSEYEKAVKDQDQIFEHYATHPDVEGMDLKTAKKEWKQQAGLRDFSDKILGATEHSPTGNIDYQFKQGKQLAERINDVIKKNPKTHLLDRIGFTEDHIDQLQKFGRIVEQQAKTPRFGNFMGAIGKTVAAMAGFHGGGMIGAGAGLVGEGLAEKFGGWAADHILGKALTTPEALKTLTTGFKEGTNPSVLVEKLKTDIHKSDPSWAETIGNKLGQMVKGERGEAEVPFTGGTGVEENPRPKVTTDYENDSTGKFGNQDHMVTTKDADGKTVGQLAAQDAGQGKVVVRFNRLNENFRGQGIGKQQLEKLFTEAEKGGAKTVKSDISTTGDAQHVWESLERKYPDAITKKMVGKGASAKPQWTANLAKIASNVANSADDALAASSAAKRGAGRAEGSEAGTEGAAPVAAPTTSETPYTTSQASAPAKLPTEAERQPGQRVSQRNPTAVNAPEDPMTGNLDVGMDAIKKHEADKPGAMRKMALAVSKYPGVDISPEEALANPEAALNKFVNHISGNLEWLHNQVPANIRNISKLWYDSAHVLTKDIAKQYGLAHEQVAGIVASLSPKNEWNNNVELAKRMIHTYKTQQGFRFTPEMEGTAVKIGKTNRDIVRLLDDIRGKTLGELKYPDEKAAWIRLHDESYNHKMKSNYAPDGSVRDFARNQTGEPTSSAWNTGLPAMIKAVKIMDDGSMENIHHQLGEAHKIRNFYNNIVDPWSKHGDVTIDTHAVGAGHLRPMSQKSEEVLHNFGSSYNPSAPGAIGGTESSSSIGSTVTGNNGLYSLYAEAYRTAAKRLGILPRELQSITWEGIRSLYEAKEKSPELTKTINQILKDHKDGDSVTGQKVSIERARKQIVKAAGGFKDPQWLTDIKGADAAKAGK